MISLCTKEKKTRKKKIKEPYQVYGVYWQLKVRDRFEDSLDECLWLCPTHSNSHLLDSLFKKDNAISKERLCIFENSPVPITKMLLYT